MSVIDLAAARARRAAPPPSHPITDALDALALALAAHGHEWTERERQLYETAISYLSGGCTGSD
jgi:hypothetical protein